MSDEDVEAFLAHYGVKGMRWGHRRDDLEDVSRATNKEASKDAAEFARAKMFYGEGAGTRRKLVKAKVEAKMKKDPAYKKAFDHHLEQQDLGRHASKARSERRRKDTVQKTTKTARGIDRALNGGFGPVSTMSAILASGYIAARKTGTDKVVFDHLKESFSKVSNDTRRRRKAQSFLRDAGLGDL